MTTKIKIENDSSSSKAVRVHHLARPSTSSGEWTPTANMTAVELKPGETHEVWVHDTFCVRVEEC